MSYMNKLKMIQKKERDIQPQGHDQEGDRGQNVQSTTSVPPSELSESSNQNVQIQNPLNYNLSFDSIQYITDPRTQQQPSIAGVPIKESVKPNFNAHPTQQQY